MSDAIDLNQNLAHCIQTVNHIGSTTYVNICNHTVQTVAWGGGDWILAIVLGVIVGGVTLLILIMVAAALGFLRN